MKLRTLAAALALAATPAVLGAQADTAKANITRADSAKICIPTNPSSECQDIYNKAGLTIIKKSGAKADTTNVTPATSRLQFRLAENDTLYFKTTPGTVLSGMDPKQHPWSTKVLADGYITGKELEGKSHAGFTRRGVYNGLLAKFTRDDTKCCAGTVSADMIYTAPEKRKAPAAKRVSPQPGDMPPEITIVVPKNGDVFTADSTYTARPTVRVTDDKGIGKIVLELQKPTGTETRVIRENATNTLRDTTFTESIPGLTPGAYTIIVRAQDTGKNTDVEASSFRVENQTAGSTTKPPREVVAGPHRPTPALMVGGGAALYKGSISAGLREGVEYALHFPEKADGKRKAITIDAFVPIAVQHAPGEFTTYGYGTFSHFATTSNYVETGVNGSQPTLANKKGSFSYTTGAGTGLIPLTKGTLPLVAGARIGIDNAQIEKNEIIIKNGAENSKISNNPVVSNTGYEISAVVGTPALTLRAGYATQNREKDLTDNLKGWKAGIDVHGDLYDRRFPVHAEFSYSDLKGGEVGRPAGKGAFESQRLYVNASVAPLGFLWHDSGWKGTLARVPWVGVTNYSNTDSHGSRIHNGFRSYQIQLQGAELVGKLIR